MRFLRNMIRCTTAVVAVASLFVDASPASAQFDIGGPNGVVIGGGYGLRIGGRNGVQFGGGEGAKFGGSNGVQFGGGQGAKFGGPDGVQFGGGQGAKFGGEGGLQVGGPQRPPVQPQAFPGDEPVIVEEPPMRRPGVRPLRPALPPTMLYYPKEADRPLDFTLNGHRFAIKPGQTVSLRSDQRWLLRFDAAADGAERHYAIPPGNYTFKQRADGWNLFRNELARPTPELLPAPSRPGAVLGPSSPWP